MFTRVLRDADLVPAMDEATARVTDPLDEDCPAPGSRTGVAVAWCGRRSATPSTSRPGSSLVRDRGLTRRQAVTLMCAMVAAAR